MATCSSRTIPLLRGSRYSNASLPKSTRDFASVHAPVSTASHQHKVLIVGGGSAGATVGHQLLRSGQFTANDIAIVDPAQWHHYQPGWTLVGGGLKQKQSLRRPMKDIVDSKIRLYSESVQSFAPTENAITTDNGSCIGYEQLVVCPGVKVDFDSISGLRNALDDPHAPVSSIYSYDTCDKTAQNLANFSKGKALFTQPAGVVKCAGAPQKIMWLALDGWKKAGRYIPDRRSESPVQVTFSTGLPVMFGVPKYSQALDELRQKRGVEALFKHDLIAIEGNEAVFRDGESQETRRMRYDLLHAVPKMGPHPFVKESPIANEAGFVDVDDATLRHKRYPNIWACGDASSLPTSKTAAAITAQAPILVTNLLGSLNGHDISETYNGYTSCPLLTEYGKVMLAEFAYGGKPHETFGRFVDQATPRRAFYHLKKDFFPWVYFQSMVKGTWAGPKGWMR